MRDMEASKAVARFRAAGKRESTAVRMVGYAVLVQHGGRESIHRLMDTESAGMLRRAFEVVDVAPGDIIFTDARHPYLEELAPFSTRAQGR